MRCSQTVRGAAVFIAIVGAIGGTIGATIGGCAPARGPVVVPPPAPDAGVDAPWVASEPPPPPAPLEPLPPLVELVAPAPPVARACPAPAGPLRDRAFGPVTAILSRVDDPHVAQLGGAAFVATITRDAGITLATSTDHGATWAGATRLDDPADCAGLTTACAIDPQLLAAGNELYAFYAGDDIGVRVRASHDRGATFGPSTIALGGAVAGVTASADGHVHVAAIRGGPLGAYGSANHVLEYAASIDHGAHFSRPIAISGRDDQLPLLAARPALATDTARKLIYVVYVRGGRDLAWELVVATSKDLGATWKRTIVALPSPCALRLAPAAAIDPATGTLHVIWFDSRGLGLIAHATCPTGASRCTELAAISDAPIATPLDPAGAAPQPIAALAIDSKRHTLRAIWTQLDAAGAPTLVQATAPLAHR